MLKTGAFETKRMSHAARPFVMPRASVCHTERREASRVDE